jgi:outer membrane protein assembly factor BamB
VAEVDTNAPDSVYAIDRETGDIRWSRQLGDQKSVAWTSERPGEVWTSDGSDTWVLDVSDGSTISQYAIRGYALDFVGDRLFGSGYSGIIEVDPTDGSELWKVDHNSSNGQEAMGAGPEGVFWVDGDELRKVTLDGTTRTTPDTALDSGNTIPEVHVSGGLVIVPGEPSGGVAAYDAETGDRLWDHSLHQYGPEDAVVTNGYVVSIGNGGFYAVNADDGSQVFTQLQVPNANDLIVDGNTYFLGGSDQAVREIFEGAETVLVNVYDNGGFKTA